MLKLQRWEKMWKGYYIFGQYNVVKDEYKNPEILKQLRLSTSETKHLKANLNKKTPHIRGAFSI
jgi:hypothetical protein